MIKRFLFSMSMVFVLFASPIFANSEAFEEGDSTAPIPITKEYLEQIEKTNNLIEQYIEQKKSQENPRLRVETIKKLSVPLYQQKDEVHCAPASMKMVIQYINSASPSQDTLRTDVGKSPTTDAVARVLNTYISTGKYEYVNLSNASFSGSIRYSIDKNRPLIFQILAGPPLKNYTTTGNGHYIVGTGYEIYIAGGSSIEYVYYSDPHHDSKIYGSYYDTMANMQKAITNRTGHFVRGV